MPIRPENIKRYPANWPDIRARIRERSGNRCECTGQCGQMHGGDLTGRCERWHLELLVREGRDDATVILTVMHLNHTPEDCRDENLLHACQGCHNRYDAPVRRAGIQARARAQRAAGDLLDLQGNHLMARIRSVHPELFLDDAFMELSPDARLLAIGIWTQCDDHGIFEWKPKYLKAVICPGDMVDVTVLMDELQAFNCIHPFEEEGRGYGAVRNFCLYQRPKKPVFKHPFPDWCRTYVAIDRRKAQEVANQPPTKVEPVTPSPPTAGENRSHRRGEKRKGSGEEDSSNHIDKPVVVVVPREPETPAGTTTTTQVENDLARQGGAAKPPVSPLGTALPETWIPDEACITVAFEHGMGELDIEPEVLRFHALNAQRGTFSQNWSKTWTLWCAEFKRRAAKDTAKAPPRVEVSAGYKLTLEQWHAAARRWATTQQWSGQLGPDPESPACRCPKDILAAHNIDPATGIVRKPAPTENA